MIEILISDTLLSVPAGIYKIEFSNGFFYIGKSSTLGARIRCHIRSIDSDFSNKRTCVSLTKMRGFKGIATFSLIEATDIASMIKREANTFMLERESFYIVANRKNKKCLNWVHNPDRKCQPNVH